ncbi:MAG: hypothetical protein RJA99_4174 [Pseudomonadota bacterium]
MQHDLALADRAAPRSPTRDKTAAQKAVEFMSQLAGFAPIRSVRSSEVEAVRNLVHGHLVTALHPVADPQASPEGVDLLRVRWGGAGAESVEHFSEMLSVAIVQSARHEETIGEVDDARLRARALADHFRTTYGVEGFALF